MLATAEIAERLPKSDLLWLSHWLADKAGLDFPPRRFDDLERRLRDAARDLGYPDCRSCFRAIVEMDETSNGFAALIRNFTVGETYFFREEATFDALARIVLPAIIDARHRLTRRLRIWSAACSTGEEPYSVAILLDRLLRAADDWHVTLLASDIDPRALEAARAGVYRHWSFRGVLEPWHQRYFDSVDDGRFRLRQEIRERVTFVPMNLAEDAYPSLANNTNALDLVLCRNALMYFRQDQARRVVERFRRCLLPGGWLLVSAVEAASDLFSEFEHVPLDGITVYRKPALVGSEVFETKVRAGGGRLSQDPLPATIERPEVAPPAATAVDGHHAGSLDEAESPGAGHGEPDAPGQDRESGASLEALYLEGRYQEAAEAARARIAEDGDPAAMNLLARVSANLGRLPDALHWADAAVRADEFGARHHYLLAVVQQELHRPEEAVASLRRALYLDPKFILAHFALGGVLRRQGLEAASRRMFRAALRLANQCPPDEAVPEADGLVAGRLEEILTVLLQG